MVRETPPSEVVLAVKRAFMPVAVRRGRAGGNEYKKDKKEEASPHVWFSLAPGHLWGPDEIGQSDRGTLPHPVFRTSSTIPCL